MSYYNLPEQFRLETHSAKALQSRLGMKLLNTGSLELWPLRACFARLYNFSLPRDYRIPARLGWEACGWENFTQGKQWRLERGIEIESSQK